MSQKLKFTIVIPFKNAQKTILRCLESCKIAIKNAELEKSVEIVLCDNNSLDNTYAIIEKWRRNNIEIISYIYKTSTENGPGIGRNLGVLKSNSKYILFLDSDDVILPSTFNEIEEFLQFKKQNIDLIVMNYTYKDSLKIIDRYRNLAPYLLHKESLMNEYVSMGLDGSVIAMIFRTEFILNNFFENGLKFKSGIFEDLPFLAAAIKYATTIEVLDTSLYIKNKTLESITSSWNSRHNIYYLSSWMLVYQILGNLDGVSQNSINRGLRGIIGVCISIINEQNLTFEVQKKEKENLRELVNRMFPWWRLALDDNLESFYDKKFKQFAIEFLL